jgi:hypothetical protein
VAQIELDPAAEMLARIVTTWRAGGLGKRKVLRALMRDAERLVAV